ncbi:unnamed protein product [Effrenium voratum]|nr:unnamed protein product [Effrenium voratum]
MPNDSLPGCRSTSGRSALAARTRAAAADWARVLHLFDAGERDAVLGTASLSGLARRDHWRSAICLLDVFPSARLQANVISYTAALGACERGGHWQQAVALLATMSATRGAAPNEISAGAAMSACEKAGQWQAASLALWRVRAGRLQLNTVLYNTAIFACRGSCWLLAGQLLGDLLGRTLQPDLSTASSSVAVQAREGRWRSAVFQLPTQNVVARGAALSAFTSRWDLALWLLGLRPDAVCINAACTACERQLHWRQALRLAGSEFAASAAWRRAKVAELSEDQPQAAAVQEAPNTLPKLAVLLWSSASLGLDAGHLCAEVSERLRHREGQVLDVRQMADLAWALSMLPSDSTTMVSLQHLQWDLARLTLRGSLPPDFPDRALTVLWSSCFAGCSSHQAAEVVWRALQEASQAQGGASAVAPLTLKPPLAPSPEPRVALQLRDKAVVFKPPGWQVDYSPSGKTEEAESDGKARSHLSDFLRALEPSRAQITCPPQHGFIHRLDVPSSGLILAARTWGSFYDLKLQLALGLLQRDYAVLCHGWRPDRSEIAAAVRWLGRLGRRPSEVAPGRRARTRLKAAAHLGRVGQACSFLVLRLVTGRRHQIRLHLAHVGSPVVADAKYASAECCKEDLQWCSHFLHRYCLSFLTSFGGSRVDSFESLPPDLAQTAAGLAPVRGAVPVLGPGADLSGNFFGAPGFAAAAAALGTTRLRWLSFAGNGQSPGEVEAELPARPFLRSADEADKERAVLGLGTQHRGLKQAAGVRNPLQLFLEGLQVNDTLEELDISNCVDTAWVLQEALQRHQKLKSLRLCENPLGETGLRFVFRLMTEMGDSLEGAWTFRGTEKLTCDARR